MSAGRRGLILSVAFLGLALWLSPEQRATAQPIQMQPNDPGAGRHTLWKRQLSPDQIRDLLGKFGQDDGKGDPFEDMLRQIIQNKNPNVPPEQVDAAVKRFMNNKEFRDRMIDLAQNQKNRMRDNGKGGPPPKLSREDIDKLGKILPDGGTGEPFKLPDEPFPKFDPNTLPPFDPHNPQFDPARFPKIDPKHPPKFDPDTKFPLDPDTGRPFDPRNGRPIDPKNPPRIDPPQPKVEPPDPKVDPKGGPPVEPPADGKRRFDPEHPLGLPNDPPEKIAKSKAVEAATALWEKNVGPIEESPAVKRAILDLVSDSDAMDALTDGKGRNIFEALENGGDDKLGNLFGNGDSGWEWPKFDLPWSRGRDFDFDVGSSRPRPADAPRSSSPRGPSSMDGLGSFNFGGVKVPWVLFLILLGLVVGAVIWWKWNGLIGPRAAVAGAGEPPPWPIDPREINSREDVVKAFEYLSVMICGPGAKMWTHSTIADELSALAETHGETAVKLARLYELARYAPLDEPLTRAELLEARRLVCDLAGMDHV